jgi:uncharacterized protein YbbK (DUF523 family)
MEKILVSACLLGERVRYDGAESKIDNQIFDEWHREGRLIPVCPEMAGGLPSPRPAAEIFCGDGAAVLAGMNQVVDIRGRDVTNYFLQGAAIAVQLVRQHHIKLAILKDGSPSCGSNTIYDGSFTGTKIPGQGITTLMLEQQGVRVFAETEINSAAQWLERLERARAQ